MRVIRVIFGFLLLFGAATEYAVVIRHFDGPFYPPAFFVSLAFVFVCAWLIGGGFSKEKLKIKSLRFVIFFVVTMILFVLLTIIKLSAYRTSPDIAEVNGMKIPIGRCIDGSINMVPDVKERKEYCICLAEKLSGSTDVVNAYKSKLEAGDLAEVFEAVRADQSHITLGLESCFYSVNAKCTDNVLNGMKKNCREQLQNTDFEKTNDVEKFCDCLGDEYRKRPMNEVTSEVFVKALQMRPSIRYTFSQVSASN